MKNAMNDIKKLLEVMKENNIQHEPNSPEFIVDALKLLNYQVYFSAMYEEYCGDVIILFKDKYNDKIIIISEEYNDTNEDLWDTHSLEEILDEHYPFSFEYLNEKTAYNALITYKFCNSKEEEMLTEYLRKCQIKGRLV